MTDLKIENFENDLYYAINSARISDLRLLNSCLYINTDNTWKNPIIKFVSAISNHKKKFNDYNINLLILTYQNVGHVISLNDWDNPEYFSLVLEDIYL